jgi:hypothetical protein
LVIARGAVYFHFKAPKAVTDLNDNAGSYFFNGIGCFSPATTGAFAGLEK